MADAAGASMSPMPPLAALATLAILAALVDASARVRIPVGLLVAIAVLASGMSLPVALVAAATGATAARGWLAARSRRTRRAAAGTDAGAVARRALQARIATSRAYARTTFLLGAMPAVPPTFSFPLLGAMRGPLWPALAGSFVGRLPVLAATALPAIAIARLVSDGDAEAARVLAALVALLLLVRLAMLVDREHRARTGEWRLREPGPAHARLGVLLDAAGAGGEAGAEPGRARNAHDLVVEGELLGEEVDDDQPGEDDDDDPGPPSLPPTGLAPS